MPNDLDIDADPFLKLLTDALRAGPGSPEWHQAIGKLRRDGLEGSEHAMLVSVREQLESGKEYRSVSAGPGFTRRLMERLDDEPTGKRRSLPVATLLVVVGAVAVTLIVIGGLFILLRGADDGLAVETARLRDGTFATVVSAASFDGAIPAGWSTSGKLKLDARAGLRPAATQPSPAHLSGEIYSTTSIPAGGSAAIEALVRAPGDREHILQLVVAGEAATGEEKARELAWVLSDGKARVALPDGRFTGAPTDFPRGDDGTLVRVAVGPAGAVVSVGGRELYAGPNGLSPDAPRHFAIRFLTKGGRGGAGAVLSARIVEP